MRTLRTIDYTEARAIIDAIAAEAAKTGGAAVIAVADPHGELIAFARMDGAPVSSIRIAANKAYSAARERKTTEEIGQKSRHPEKGFEIAYFGDDRFVGWGGGVPVWRGGEVVGAIAVSGLPQAEDIRMATWAAALVRELNRDRGEPRGSAPPTPPDMRVRIRRFGGLSYSRTVNLGIPSKSK